MTDRWNPDATPPAPATAPALTQAEIDRRVFDLYDEYCHGRIDRREFLQRAGLLTVGGVSALAMAQALLPRYALAQTISFTDQMHMYPGTQHGFHNNSTPRYHEASAKPAWERTIAFFKRHVA